MIKKFGEPIEKYAQDVRKEVTDLQAKARFQIKEIIVKL